jgi:Tol biopolymer transport system component/fibronectin type 3 domain-containing protein
MVDRTSPVITLFKPSTGDVYGGNSSTVAIWGEIEETNLNTYTLRYGAGANPQAWTELLSGGAVPADGIHFELNAGKESAIADGVYTVSLYAEDEAGNFSESKVLLTVDNTLPVTTIESPAEGEFIRNTLLISGTASDPNLSSYMITMSEGRCDSTARWMPLMTGNSSAVNRTLLSLDSLPADGEYCIKLTAEDRVENTSSTEVNITVDTTPPSAPVLTGYVDDNSAVRLNWDQTSDSDVAGYIIYRNGKILNKEKINKTTYLDADIGDGKYTYQVKAVDFAGWESELSNSVSVAINRNAPDVSIIAPSDGERLKGVVVIEGTAYSRGDFKEYRVYAGKGLVVSDWSLIRRSPLPVFMEELGRWITGDLSDGIYSIKLEAEDTTGNIATDTVTVSIDNTPPTAPVLLSVRPDNNEVIIEWQSNTEPDLAGYLLFRDDRIVNASGSITDLNRYLLTGSSYTDKEARDGLVRYYMIAVDSAGNLSQRSNIIEADLDTHPPHVKIVDPMDKASFDKVINITAYSPDTDIATVRFQYRAIGETVWHDLGLPLTVDPYTVSLDPVTLGMSYGDYQVRAVAIDKNNNTDPSPEYITISYIDTLPPAAPSGLSAHVEEGMVTLSWDPNTDPDLEGYLIYRKTSSGYTTLLNYGGRPISGETFTTYQPEGEYSFFVKAVDNRNNLSTASDSVIVTICQPKIDTPYSPSKYPDITLTGTGCRSGDDIELRIMGIMVQRFDNYIATKADKDGNFNLDIQLTPGLYRMSVRAIDSNGNISMRSRAVYVLYDEPPAPPTGLAMNVNGYEVSLSWNSNTENDLAGYNVYRNGELINETVQADGNAYASNYSYPDYPVKAVDGNPDTYWTSNGLNNGDVWFQFTAATEILLKKMTVDWGSCSVNNDEFLCGGREFDIQAWNGYAWMTIKEVTGNSDASVILDFNPGYKSRLFRIVIHSAIHQEVSRMLRIAEIRLYGEKIITEPQHVETVRDGHYQYYVTAVDRYGLESLPSNVVEDDVGDIMPPSPPVNVTAVTYGHDIVISWDMNTEPDIDGYNIYRMSPGGWVKVNEVTVKATEYIDQNLPNGTYRYRVTALDLAGNESLPSDEVMANLDADLPAEPVGMACQALPEGRTLRISWGYLGSPVKGFNLYRSFNPGGPYTLLNNDFLAQQEFTDSGLINGKAYYYVSSAVDDAGNEGPFSEEISCIPRDTMGPSRPEIIYPIRPGKEIEVTSNTVILSGIAAPGVGIRLFRNGDPAGETIVNSTVLRRQWTFPAAPVSYVAISPDGRTVIYTDPDGYLYIMDMNNGMVTQTEIKGYRPSWSSDNRRVAYYHSNRVYLLDTKTFENKMLSKDSYYYENFPSWSPDGRQIALYSYRDGRPGIWIWRNDTGGFWFLTGANNAFDIKWSPDSRYLAYRDREGLHYVSLQTGDVNDISVADYYSVIYNWSPDSTSLVYSSQYAIYQVNTETSEVSLLVPPEYECFNPVWSPDGKSLMFASYDRTDNQYKLIAMDLYAGSMKTIDTIGPSIDDISLQVSPSGRLVYKTSDIIHVLELEGFFRFPDISLDAGYNTMYAIALDEYGNESEPSESILLHLRDSQLPDVTITGDDIYIYPPYPVSGEAVSFNMVVYNSGSTAAEDVSLDVYLADNNNLEYLGTYQVDYIPAADPAIINIDLPHKLRAGKYNIVAVVDPLDTILESDETNNLATKEFQVFDRAGISVITTIPTTMYTGNEDMGVDIKIWNSGSDSNIIVRVTVEDKTGAEVETLDERTLDMHYASHERYTLIWNTGSLYPGEYRIHSIALQGAEVLDENIIPFIIVPDVEIKSSIVTDKTLYGPYEDVNATVSVVNRGTNYIVPETTVRVRFIDLNGDDLFLEERPLVNLLPGGKAVLSFQWNTGFSPPGSYRVMVEIFCSGESVSQDESFFTLEPSLQVDGAMSISPAIVSAGKTVSVYYNIKNKGNIDIVDLPVRVLIARSDNMKIIASREWVSDLAVGAAVDGSFNLSTNGYRTERYKAILQFTYGGKTFNIASLSFEVRDGTPPVVNAISPVPGGYYNGEIEMSVFAKDDLSGLERVEYQIDGDEWRSMALSDQATGKYMARWTPSGSDEGQHTIRFRARDRAGNISPPTPIKLTVDLTPPEAPLVVSPAPDSFVNEDLITIKGNAEAGSKVRMVYEGSEITVWSDPLTGVFSFNDINLSPGENAFVFTAEDMAGNISPPVIYTVYLDISRWFTGSIVVKPDPVYRGRDITITYSITNSGGRSVFGIDISILIVDQETGITVKAFETRIDIDANTTMTDNIVLKTQDLKSGDYTAVLQIDSDLMEDLKELDRTSFGIKAGLEVSKLVPDITNLLVWVNEDCHGKDGKDKDNDDEDKDDVEPGHKGRKPGDKRRGHGEDDGDGRDGKKDRDDDDEDDGKCMDLGLLQSILRETGGSSLIVFERKEFEQEMRNSYYTDILIIGDHHHLTDHYGDELSERVYGGTGLISSLFLIKGDDDHEGDEEGDEERTGAVFGLKYSGHLPKGKGYRLETEESPVRGDTSLRKGSESRSTGGGRDIWLDRREGKG